MLTILTVLAWAVIVALLGVQIYLLRQVLAWLPDEDTEPESTPRESESRRRDQMDEGVENILTYSVRGKTGFETQDDEE